MGIRPPTAALVHSLRSFSSARQLAKVRPFILADVGEGIKECEVAQWLVQPGARVAEFDPICEVQSDKAAVEITSRYSGVIKSLNYEVGDMAAVGSPLLDIDVDEEQSDEVLQASSDAPDAGPPVQPANNKHSPSIGAFDLSESAKIITPEGLSVAAQAPEVAEPTETAKQTFLKSLATPAVRRICMESHIDIHSIHGTGKDGRVLKEDVLRALETPKTQAEPLQETPQTSTPQTSKQTVQLSPIEKQMVKTMTQSTQIPHFLYSDEIELDALMQVRNSINKKLENQGHRLSYMPFFIKALSLSLKRFPRLNARLLEQGDAVEINPAHNIAIAVDTPKGLLVPNIKNVQSKSILEVHYDLKRLQEAAKKSQLTTEDMQGSTISLSNIGTVGGTVVGPVIVPGQVAIGGIGAIRRLPRFGPNDEIIARNIVHTSWSGDHRALDGATLARMVSEWKNLLENPSDMLLELV